MDNLMRPCKRQRRPSPMISGAAELIGHNEGLMTHISVHLPVRSVLRFRSISKQWHSTLTHPYFIKQHAFRSKSTNNSLLFFKPTKLPRRCIESFNNHNHSFGIAYFSYLLQKDYNPPKTPALRLSCNGLLLLASKDFKEQRRDNARKIRLRIIQANQGVQGVQGVEPEIIRFYVCNPSTRTHSELALPDHIAKAPDILARLAFDPCTSPYYKVIFFRKRERTSHLYHISIYSSETKVCRELRRTVKTRDGWFEWGAFFNGGAVSWVEKHFHRNSSYLDINRGSIHVFPKPPYSGSRNFIRYFGSGYGGHLHLILGAEKHHLDGNVLDVYELKEDYSRWVPKYKVDLHAIAAESPQIIDTERRGNKFYNYLCLRVCPLEKEEEPTLVLSIANQLLAYNLGDKTTKKLYVVTPRGEWDISSTWWDEAFHCIQTLSYV